MLTLVQAADAGASPSIPWLVPTIAILTLLLGGGGIGALLKVRHDKRMGVAQQEVAEDDALSNLWKAIIEAQTKSLLEPLTTELADLRGRFTVLEGELALSRRKYWSAISHIRTLYTWISRHLPEDFEATKIPEPPATLAEDL